MRSLSRGRTPFAPRFYEIKERDLTLCACQLMGKQFWSSAIEVKDEQLPLSIKTEYGWKMAYNATTWTERSNPSWHARFGLVGAAAMRDLHVIQGPNVTRDARAKIAFFAFHAFVVEDSRFEQNRVMARLYNCGACVCKSNVEIRIAGSFCRPQKRQTKRFLSWTKRERSCSLNRLTPHPQKSEDMLICKTRAMGPAAPIYIDTVANRVG